MRATLTPFLIQHSKKSALPNLISQARTILALRKRQCHQQRLVPQNTISLELKAITNVRNTHHWSFPLVIPTRKIGHAV